MAHISPPKQTAKGTAYVVRWRPQSGTFKEKTFYNMSGRTKLFARPQRQ